MAMTREEVIDRASAFALDTNHTQIKKVEKEAILQTVYIMVTDQYYEKQPSLYLSSTTIPTEIDSGTIDFPSDSRWVIFQIKRVGGGELVYSGAPYDTALPTGDPVNYKVVGGKIHLRPIPNTVQDLELQYFRTANEIQQPTSDVELPPNQETALIYYLASELWELKDETGRSNRYANKGQKVIDSWKPFSGASQEPRIERLYSEGNATITNYGEETWITSEGE